jgi:hypothetical protein
VIASAIRDLEKPTRAGGKSYEWERLARAFLVVSNPKPGVLVPHGELRHERDPKEILQGREGGLMRDHLNGCERS